MQHVSEAEVLRAAGIDGYLLFYQFDKEDGAVRVDLDADVAAGMIFSEQREGHDKKECRVM